MKLAGSIETQQGALLPLALFAMLFITILGISSVRQTGDQLRVASYQQDAQLAFQAAEAALRYGERLAEQGIQDGNDFIGSDWEGDGGREFTEFGGLELVDELPRVYIGQSLQTGFEDEQQLETDSAHDGGSGRTENYYQITSRATGRSSDTVVILRSYYRP